jgi:HPt (histidine-containing phosphotransfer) domain-containing protein/two-component sensor histidine kinase
MKSRPLIALLVVGLIACVTFLWQKTRSVDPAQRARIDSALRELRSLDRTINQDVLRARYQLIQNYEPVLRSYRRLEELEAVIAAPPAGFDEKAKRNLAKAVSEYRVAVTRKQGLIEDFKYRTAALKELLGYLPGAGVGVAQAAADTGDQRLAADVTRVLQLTLLYNLTSDEAYAPKIRAEVDALAVAGESANGYIVKRRVRTFVMNIRTLLGVKPEVDRQLLRLFEEPVTQHEEIVARNFYAGYAAADEVASRYRIALYASCLALLVIVGVGVLRLQQTARALAVSNDRLEERVIERTRELDAINREMKAVLDNVDQALFTVDLDGKMSRERSAALSRFFPHADGEQHFPTMVAKLSSSAASWIELGWESLRDGLMPAEFVLEQLPRHFGAEDKHYELEYRAIGDPDHPEKVLVVISDVSERVQNAEREKQQREQLSIFQQVMRDRVGFIEFFREGERLTQYALNEREEDRSGVVRAIHTLKGNSGLYGASSLASACHQIELRLVEAGESLGDEDRELLARSWRAFAEKVAAFVDLSRDGAVELSPGDLQALREAAATDAGGREVLTLLQNFEYEPAERWLTRMTQQAQSLAARLNKPGLVVQTEANGVRLDRERWSPIGATFVHLLRNALDHGIEMPEERTLAGKPNSGRLSIRMRQTDEHVVVELSDDGRGIDWAALREKAYQLGMPCETEPQLLKILFRGGLSSKSTLSEFSGRGAGLSAVYEACGKLGANISVVSEPGQGTTFRISVPKARLFDRALTSAA